MGLDMAGQHASDLGQNRLLLARAQGRNVAHSPYPVDHAFGSRQVLVVEGRRLHPSEPRALAPSRVPPVLVISPGGSPLDAVHDRPHLVDPVDRPVSGVPEHGHSTTRAQHPRQLGEGLLRVEPMKRLGDADGIERGSLSGRDSAAPATDATVGSSRPSTWCIAHTGSMAMIRAPLGTKSLVSLPVPAPRSATVVPGPTRPWCSSHSTASGG